MSVHDQTGKGDLVSSIEALKADIAALSPWHSPFDLGNGIVTKHARAAKRFARRLRLFHIPNDLTGKRVLDVGTWDGFFAFELERRGANVLAIDIWGDGDDGLAFKQFQFMHKMKNSRIAYQRMDVHQVNPEAIGKFDLVLCAGVLYHCRHPLLALEKLRSVTDGLLILETVAMIPAWHGSSPMIMFFPGDKEAIATKWPGRFCAGATLPWIRAAMLSAGFKRVEHVYRPSMAWWKKSIALITNTPNYGRSVTHAFT